MGKVKQGKQNRHDRRLVMQQQAEKSLFQWSTGGKALTWQELAGNLVRLTGTSLEPGTDVPPP